MFRRLSQSGELIVRRQPAGQRLEQPQLPQAVAVLLRGRASQLLSIASSRRVQDAVVRRARGGRCRVGAEPGQQRIGATYEEALLGEVVLCNPLHVAVEQSPPGSR